MDRENSTIDNLVCVQAGDRRRGRRLEPPYITDEGFVLVDRRGEGSRPPISASLSLCEPEDEAVLS